MDFRNLPKKRFYMSNIGFFFFFLDVRDNVCVMKKSDFLFYISMLENRSKIYFFTGRTFFKIRCANLIEESAVRRFTEMNGNYRFFFFVSYLFTFLRSIYVTFI